MVAQATRRQVYVTEAIERLYRKGVLSDTQREAAARLYSAFRSAARPVLVSPDVDRTRAALGQWVIRCVGETQAQHGREAWAVLEAIAIRGHYARSAALGGMRSERVERLLRLALDVVAEFPPPA